MASDTKNLIYHTFIDLLSTKPFDKITIRDIVDACEINRNTFYYYYSDIYDLLEEIFTKKINEMIEAHGNGKSWVTAFIKIANEAYEHKKMIYNICSSRSYEYLENYMYRACNQIIIEVVKNVAEDMDVPDEDIEFIASFYEYGFVGVLSEWFKTGMREDPFQLASQLWLVVDNIRYALKRSQRRMKSRIENEDFV
ncbi:MAG: TetR/AcrR family transcriptional regulator [Clostridia bacterium]|nr:TetR/AcrR family transcriptional regulator [Clostridia bacterium]